MLVLVLLKDDEDESAILAEERRQQQQMQEGEQVQADLSFLRDREQRVHQLEVSQCCFQTSEFESLKRFAKKSTAYGIQIHLVNT